MDFEILDAVGITPLHFEGWGIAYVKNCTSAKWDTHVQKLKEKFLKEFAP